MRVHQKLLVLCLAGSALGYGATAKRDHRDLWRDLNSVSVAGWALSDFDGDSQVDVATTAPAHGDGRGYSHEVRVDLSQLDQNGAFRSSFTFRTATARVQISTQDLDGDHDRDIVILESASLMPLSVWLNDGSGHFREGELAQFKGVLSSREGAALQSAQILVKPLYAIFEQRAPVATLDDATSAPERLSQALTVQSEAVPQCRRSSAARPRAPPRNI